jgi:hypothetical protein
LRATSRTVLARNHRHRAPTERRGRLARFHLQPVRFRALVLLEVVLALGLFVMTAGIVSAGLAAALGAEERIRREANLADRLVTLFASLEIGALPLLDGGPNPFPDVEDDDTWQWELSVEPWEIGLERDPGLVRVVATVRHLPSGTAHEMARILRTRSLPAGSAPEIDPDRLARVQELFSDSRQTPEGGSP